MLPGQGCRRPGAAAGCQLGSPAAPVSAALAWRATAQVERADTLAVPVCWLRTHARAGPGPGSGLPPALAGQPCEGEVP